MTNFQDRFSVRWLVVNYLMIAGGFMLAALAAAAADPHRAWVDNAVFFVGGLVGGFFAGRASPRKTIVESGLAAVLLTFTLVGLKMWLPADQLWTDAGGFVAVAAKVGFVAGLGALVGGVLAHRTSGGRQSSNAWFWWGTASLLNAGAVCLVMALTILLQWVASVGVVPLALLGGGFVAQAVAPRRMIWVSGAGALWLTVLAFAVLIRADVEGWMGTGPAMLPMAALLASVSVAVSALGARLGWALVGSRRPDRIEQPPPPEARLR